MNRVFKRRKPFFLSLLSVVFLYTANRPDENELIQLFELSQKGHLYTGQRVHKIRVFIPEVIYGSKMGYRWRFLSWGALHIMTCMGRLRAKGVPFLGFRYTKEQRFHQLKYMKGQENASFRSVKRPKRTKLTITLFIFPSKKTYFHSKTLYLLSPFLLSRNRCKHFRSIDLFYTY